MKIAGTLVISPVFIVLFEFAVEPLNLGPRPPASIFCIDRSYFIIDEDPPPLLRPFDVDQLDLSQVGIQESPRRQVCSEKGDDIGWFITTCLKSTAAPAKM